MTETCTKHETAVAYILDKVVVTYYLRLRNEFLPFPAKNQVSEWLTQQANQLEAWFLAENLRNSFLYLR